MVSLNDNHLQGQPEQLSGRRNSYEPFETELRICVIGAISMVLTQTRDSVN